MQKLVLIDGNSLINRAFYATPVLSTKKGVFTNAVYGFLNMFFKMQQDIKPDFVCVAFDLKAPTFRHKAYAEYKGTRKPMPEELRPQIPLLKEVLKAMGVTYIEKEGIEADDIIGTIAKNTEIMTYIYTGDKDSFQLVDHETTVYFTRRGISDIDEYNESNFKEKTGINPLQIIDLKSLMGDASDNIPGVNGVGEKTALALVQKYGSLENVYEHIEEEKGKLKEKLILGKDLAFLSKSLATIKIDCDIDFCVENMRIKTPYSYALKEKFVELEFKSFYQREELFSSLAEIEREESLALNKNKVEVIKISELADIDLSLEKQVTIYHYQNLLSLYYANKERTIEIKENLLSDGFALSSVLNRILETANKDTTFIVYDKKEFIRTVKTALDKALNFNTEDVSILKYLFDFTSSKNVLEVIEEYAKDKLTPAYSLYLIYEELYKKMQEEGGENLYYSVELPLVDVLFDMEEEGFKVDYEALDATSKVYKEKLLALEKEIRDMCEEPNLNVNSPKQLGDVLFEKLKIGKGKKTKKGFSTSADVLESLETAHPVIPLILSYRKLQKLQSTYVEGFKPLIEKHTRLIHTRFNQTVTATGRLSSKEPNLQNIPVREEEGKELRKFFVAKYQGGVLVGADYSQIELRLLAAFSREKSLIDAFNMGADIHRKTASKVFKVEESVVTSKMRSSAKAVNFGVIYGISEYGLSKQLKISPKEAKQYIEEYFKEYPKVKDYMENNVKFAKEKGYSETLLKRRRYIPEINSSNFMTRSFGERAAMNMPLQGSSADVIKIAMIGVYNRLKKEGLKSKLILQVHDELIIDTKIEELEIVKKILKEEMEGAVNLPVKLTALVSSGKNWYDAK